MTRACLCFSLAVMLILFSAAPSPAGTVDAYSYQVTLPPGWQSSQEEHSVLFSPPGKNAGWISTVLIHMEEPDLGVLMKEEKRRGTVEQLEGVSGFFCVSKPGQGASRDWITVAGENYFQISVSVDMNRKNLKTLLAGLKTTSESPPEMEKIIVELRNPKVINALLGAKAENAAAEDEKSGKTLYRGHKFTAEVPAGWKTEMKGEATVFTSPDGSAFCLVQIIPLESEDYDDFAKSARAICKKMGGKNLTNPEGMFEFTTKEGHTVIMDHYWANNKMIIIPDNEDEDQHALMMSVNFTQ